MGMLSQSNLKVESGVALDSNGVFQYTYIGDFDEPAIEGTTTWDELIDSLVEEQCVSQTGAIVVDYSEEFAEYGSTDGVQELAVYASALRNAANKLEDRIRFGKIFIREHWANDGRPPNSTDDYCVSYEEYLNYVMEKKR